MLLNMSQKNNRHSLLVSDQNHPFPEAMSNTFGASSQGTGVGQKRNPSDPASQGLDLKTTTLRILFNVNTSPNYIHVKRDHDLNDDNDDDDDDQDHDQDDQEERHDFKLPGWEAVLWRGRLYLNVSAQQLCDGSKEAFVSLLEYAEEVLKCQHVIICLEKTNTNAKDIKMAIRNFLFLGFQPLAPGHEFLPSNPNLVCFVYTI